MDQLELPLFNEVEKEANLELPEPTVETITYSRPRRKKRGQRLFMLENLPVETIEYVYPMNSRFVRVAVGTYMK